MRGKTQKHISENPSLNSISNKSKSLPLVVLGNDNSCLYEPSNIVVVCVVNPYFLVDSVILKIGLSDAEINLSLIHISEPTRPY